MKLRSGSRLGPYEIEAPLGAGGMGEVYRARDTRLDRSVAIKVLPDGFDDHANDRLRFEREAKIISQLNHPHICAVYDVGLYEGTSYLVMELIDGQSLADRLAKGPLPLADVLKYGAQMAEALDRAHRAGIVHRDLKPGNIMLTKSGAKLLDFGLAKPRPALFSESDATAHHTARKPITQEGTIVGTLQYMSPEQLEGLQADHRTDIFAFGAVLYEMATGKRAFEGKSSNSLIASIIKDDPRPMSELVPLTPAALEHVVTKCLAKEPDDRWQSAHDVAEELNWIRAMGSQGGIPGPRLRSAASRTLPWVIVGIFAAALVAVLAGLALRRPASPLVTRLTLSLPRNNPLTIDHGIAISPDGRTVAFAATSSEVSRLYIRRLDEWEPRALPLTDGASNPFFSPDGRWIAFSLGETLQKVPASGGPPQLICKGATYGGRWLNDGTIIFGNFPPGLWRVSSDGGTPQLITRPSAGASVQKYVWPEPLPGNNGILFTIFQGGRTSIAVLAPGTDTPRILIESARHPRYLPTGHLVYIADGHLMAVRFDVERLEVRGGPTIVVDNVNESGRRSDYDVSVNGVLVYLPPEPSAAYTIVLKDRRGGTVPIVSRSRRYESPALSPDGKRLSVMIVEGSSRNIWTGGLANEPLTRLTFADDDWFGLWSRDGKRLFYTSGQNGSYNIFSIPTNGSGKAERLTQSPNNQGADSQSPDGDILLFVEIDPSTGADIWEHSLSRKESQPLLKTRFNESGAVFSPDGHWIAYASDESGQMEVYVQAHPLTGVKRQVSLEGGSQPFWSHTGTELFYRTATAMFSVPVLDAHDLRVGTPVRLFAHTEREEWTKSASADDQRFLMLEKAEANQSSQLNLVQNWFQDLQARVPAK
jgi:eukaryotic-like serine/threonine-protein kinase